MTIEQRLEDLLNGDANLYNFRMITHAIRDLFEYTKTAQQPGAQSKIRLGKRGRVLLSLSSHSISDYYVDQLRLLNEYGIPSIFMSEAYEFLEGRLELPELAVVLRWDDAPQNWYSRGLPLLQEYGHKATLFFSLWHREVAPNSSITDEQLIEMIEAGVAEVQFHAGKWGHSDQMPINGSGGKGWYHANRMWLADEGRLETDQEFKDRVDQDVKSWIEWYEEVIVPRFGRTTLHYAAPNGMMGQDADTRPLWIEVLKANDIKTATWKNHVMWMEPGFVTTDGGRSNGQTNAYFDLPGTGFENLPQRDIRDKLRVCMMEYMPSAFFASKFDFDISKDWDWYVRSQTGGDTFTNDPTVKPLRDSKQVAKLTFGENPGAGWTSIKRTMPSNKTSTYLQVIVGLPHDLVIPAGFTLPVAQFNNRQKLCIKNDGGVLKAIATQSGATDIILGTVELPSTPDKINWYALESHTTWAEGNGNFEAWFNHEHVDYQRDLTINYETNLTHQNVVQIGKLASNAGLSGSIYFARVVLDDTYIGTRGL